MGYWSGVGSNVMDVLGSLPVVSLISNIFRPRPEFNPEKEMENLKRAYAQYLQKEIQKNLRDISRKTRAEQIRRGVYVGSAYAPTQQRLNQQALEQLQSQLGRFGVQSAQNIYNYRLQDYLNEMAYRRQQMAQTGDFITSLAGAYIGGKMGGQYNLSTTQLQPEDYQTIAYAKAFIEAYPEERERVYVIIQNSAPNLIPHIFGPQQTQQAPMNQPGDYPITTDIYG